MRDLIGHRYKVKHYIYILIVSGLVFDNSGVIVKADYLASY